MSCIRMNDDGSDIAPLSYFEASEWAPSVDNNGMLVYSPLGLHRP